MTPLSDLAVKLALYHTLRNIHREEKLHDPDNGLCNTVYNLARYLYHERDTNSILGEFRKLCTSWPKYSGNYWYPVPCPEEEMYVGVDARSNASRYYNYCHNMWEGEYGKLRMQMLEFCINELENELS